MLKLLRAFGALLVIFALCKPADAQPLPDAISGTLAGGPAGSGKLLLTVQGTTSAINTWMYADLYVWNGTQWKKTPTSLSFLIPNAQAFNTVPPLSTLQTSGATYYFALRLNRGGVDVATGTTNSFVAP